MKMIRSLIALTVLAASLTATATETLRGGEVFTMMGPNGTVAGILIVGQDGRSLQFMHAPGQDIVVSDKTKTVTGEGALQLRLAPLGK